MKLFTIIIMLLSVACFSMAIYDIVARMPTISAGDYAIIGMVSLVIGAGCHSGVKEKADEMVKRAS